MRYWLLFLFGCERTQVDIEDSDINQELYVDEDGDGYFTDQDCDDSNANINPGNEEICDGVDNNCNDDSKPVYCLSTNDGHCKSLFPSKHLLSKEILTLSSLKLFLTSSFFFNILPNLSLILSNSSIL